MACAGPGDLAGGAANGIRRTSWITGRGRAEERQERPRHAEHNARGTEKNPYGKAATKAELVARMKEAAGKRTEK
ncbi:MAG: hypothetical protein R3D59_08400 [Paracoccaceae bacterium]